MDISQVLQLLCGVALFLFGMKLMGDGMKSVAGNRLELILYRLSNTTLKGMLLGTGVTAVIQSSCATSVMAVGFVNSGMMKVRQAVGVILGAILGTSITGWIVCLSYVEGAGSWSGILSTATITGVIAVAGIWMVMFTKKQTLRQVGNILMGFAVLMTGISGMSGAVGHLGELESFRSLLTTLSNPILGIAAGLLFSAVLQSASAAVGIIQALSFTGALAVSTALPLLMGVAIGGSVPVLLSAIGAKRDGKKTAAIYPISTLLSVMACASLFYIADAIFSFPFLHAVTDPFSVAAMNTALRLCMVVLLIPFTDLIEALAELLIPQKTVEDDPAIRLEERFIAHPALAVEQSRLTINSMAETAREAMETALTLLTHYDPQVFEKVNELEGRVDKFEDCLGTYLIKLTGRELTAGQNKDVSAFLHSLSDFERISDHALNIAESARELHEKKLRLSDQAEREMGVLCGAISEILTLTVTTFTEKDTANATRVEPLEELIDGLCDQMKLHHVDRLQKGECTIHQGFVFNDLLTNFERVSDHCSNVAVAIIELEADELDTHEYMSRLKQKHTQEFERYFEEYKARFTI